jgi:Helix-turn-helix domain
MICACPRKEEFEPRRSNQKYRSPDCRERARRERSPVVRLTARERESVERARMAQKSAAPRGNHPFPGYRSTRPRRMEHRPLLTTAELAELLQVSEWTVRWWRMRRVRLGPAYVRLGKARGIRYLPQDVAAWLRKHRSIQAGSGAPAGLARHVE